MEIGSSYLHGLFDSSRIQKDVKTVSRCLQELRTKTWFDAIAFRGMSGAAMAYPVFVETLIPIVCVRKPNESSHSTRLVEGQKSSHVNTYVILDDFISTGTTMREIAAAFEAAVERNIVASRAKVPKCVGIVLYMEDWMDVHTFDLNNGQPSVPIHRLQAVQGI